MSEFDEMGVLWSAVRQIQEYYQWDDDWALEYVAGLLDEEIQRLRAENAPRLEGACEMCGENGKRRGKSKSVCQPCERRSRKGAKKVEREVFERDGYRCKQCGGWERLVVDHIHPVARGGTGDIANLQTLCWACNTAKGARV